MYTQVYGLVIWLNIRRPLSNVAGYWHYTVIICKVWRTQLHSQGNHFRFSYWVLLTYRCIVKCFCMNHNLVCTFMSTIGKLPICQRTIASISFCTYQVPFCQYFHTFKPCSLFDTAWNNEHLALALRIMELTFFISIGQSAAEIFHFEMAQNQPLWQQLSFYLIYFFQIQLPGNVLIIPIYICMKYAN